MSAQRGSGTAVTVRVLGLALEMPPAVYVAITGTAPAWVRIWFVAWVSLWLLVVIVNSAAYQVKTGASR